MAHFAELDESNVVLRVVVVGNEDCQDEDGNESEAVGVAFCQNLFGADTNWKQASYNNNFRHRYPAIGDTYDETLDVYKEPKPYASWTYNSSTYEWEAPVAKPAQTFADDGYPDAIYLWDEENLQWEEVLNESTKG